MLTVGAGTEAVAPNTDLVSVGVGAVDLTAANPKGLEAGTDAVGGEEAGTGAVAPAAKGLLKLVGAS